MTNTNHRPIINICSIRGCLFINIINKNGYIKILKEGFFYSVLGNDALIFNKYFGYKLYATDTVRTGFPVKFLDNVLEKLDILSMDYKVFNRNGIVTEKSFEENCYEILDESFSYLETNRSNRNSNVFFGKAKKPNKKECIEILDGLCKNIDFYTGEYIVGLSEESKNQIKLLIEFLSPKSNTNNEIEQTTSHPKETAKTIDNKETTSTKNIVNELEVITEGIEELSKSEELNNSIIQEEKSLTCRNCLEYKKSDCFGKPQICEDFRYSPDMDDEKRKNWPKYGDASYFRMHGHRRR